MPELPPNQPKDLDERYVSFARAMKQVDRALSGMNGDPILADMLLRYMIQRVRAEYGPDFRIERFREVVTDEWPAASPEPDIVPGLLLRVVEISESGRFLRFKCSVSQIKADGINDLASRLAHLFLLVQAKINRREEVPPNELSDFLRSWHVWTNNTQAKLKRCDTIRRDGGYLRLTPKGVAQAEEYLEEVCDEQREGRLNDTNFFQQTARSLIQGDVRLEAKEAKGRHDALVIYNRQDAFDAGLVVLGLLKRGVRPWFDALDLRPSDSWLLAIERIMSETDLVISLYGKHGIGPVQKHERVGAREGEIGGNGGLVWVILPGVTGDPDIPLLDKSLAYIDMRSVEDGIERLTEAIWAASKETDHLPLRETLPDT